MESGITHRRPQTGLEVDDKSDTAKITVNTNSVSAPAESTEKGKSISTPTSITAAIISPALLTTLILIFGGCCSNVYTLEAILSISPATGQLVTFLQFLLTALFTLPSQVKTNKATSSSSFSFLPRLRPRQIPLQKWILYTTMFVTINLLNNSAFNYKISVPLHIILRSAGPVTSMLIGYLVGGRRYPPRKILAVMLLFSGVVLAALSDAWNKAAAAPPGEYASNTRPTSSTSSNRTMTSSTSTTIPQSTLTEQLPGFVLVTLALLLSAIMGLYSDHLYTQHGRSSSLTSENLFYSHTLALPMFLFHQRKLLTQYTSLLDTTLSRTMTTNSSLSSILFAKLHQIVPSIHTLPVTLLVFNAITQIICITGVHRLSTQTTSLTVSVVLNIRKLASLVLSILVFGNALPVGVIVGAVLVFIGGGVYSWPSARRETRRTAKKEL